MGKGKMSYRWAKVTTIAAIMLSIGMGVQGVERLSLGDVGQRADMITIDVLKSFHELERPAVVFLHDKHTDAVVKTDKDCLVCHTTRPDGKMSQKFMRNEDTAGKEVMDLYHDKCIECHQENPVAKEKNAPLTCAECHAETPKTVSKAKPILFDKSLHARHEKAQEGKCDACHHEYDKSAEKTVYVKGKEDSCRYCHKESREDLEIPVKTTLRESSHASCISCHTEKAAASKKTGPVKCAQCHDAENQKKIEKLSEIPRLKRNQPDAVLLTAGSKGTSPEMNPVAFDHKAHEAYNADCRSCHHASLEKCGTCHTQTGSRDGKGITLEQAMHKTGSKQSCVGCHESVKKNKECAGCHALRGTETPMEKESCVTCHAETPAGAMPEGMDTGVAAKAMLEMRDLTPRTYKKEDIPEKIVIKGLVNEYKAVDFPHRKIVDALNEGMKGSKLAGNFHKSEGSMCQGCHHNAPATAKPTSCAACHKAVKEPGLDRLSLMGAYHGQCMGCHDEMGIELENQSSESCTECHKKR